MFRRTVKELARDVKALRGRERAAWQHTAQLASWLMQAWVGSDKAPSAAKLLGEETPVSGAEAEEQLLRLTDPQAANLAALDRFGAAQAARIARGPD